MNVQWIQYQMLQRKQYEMMKHHYNTHLEKVKIKPYYVYFIPKVNYIGMTLCERQVRKRVWDAVYDDGLKIRKKEHVRQGRITERDKIVSICVASNNDEALMLEQMLIKDFYHLLSNKSITLADKKYEMYKQKINESYDYKKIKKRLEKQFIQ